MRTKVRSPDPAGAQVLLRCDDMCSKNLSRAPCSLRSTPGTCDNTSFPGGWPYRSCDLWDAGNAFGEPTRNTHIMDDHYPSYDGAPLAATSAGRGAWNR